MSKIEDLHFKIERARRQQIYDDRVRATTSQFLERYRAVLEDLHAQGLSAYIPSETAAADRQLARIDTLLGSNPSAAREMSVEVGSAIYRLPSLARTAFQAAREAALQNERERHAAQARATELLETAWQAHLGSWEDALARQLAYPLLAAVRRQLLHPGNVTLVAQLNAALSLVRTQAEGQSDALRESSRAASDAAAAKTILEHIQAQPVGKEATSSNSSAPAALVPSASELAAHLLQVTKDGDDQAIDEACRREVVVAVHSALEDAGFVTEKPRRIREGDRDEVLIRALRPSGAEAEFRVSLNGDMRYAFERYEGTACKKDMDRVLPTLQSVYGIELSDRRVVWENPDDLDRTAKARPTPGEGHAHG